MKDFTQSHRSLTAEEVDVLQRQGNTALDWSLVLITKGTLNDISISLSSIKNCTFADGGHIYLGLFLNLIKFKDDIHVHSGLYNSNFHNTCILSDNVYVSNTELVSNVYLGEGCSIVQCNQVIGGSQTSNKQLSFGAGVITVGPENNNEGTSRFVNISTDVKYFDVCSAVLQLPSSRSPSATDLSSTVEASSTLTKYLTVIGSNTHISQCDLILNSRIASGAVVRRSQVTNSTVFNSDPTTSSCHVLISGSNVAHSIIHHHCAIENNATLECVLMFPFSSVSTNAHVVHSVLASDSGISHAECCHSVLGPFVGFHHTSLLIATTWLLGRGNVGYGAMIGANHTGRSNDQECMLGEGCFIGLGSAVKFPFNSLESQYSIIAAASVCLPQKVSYPFSLICSPDVAVTHAVPTDGSTVDEKGSLLSPALNSIRPGWILWGNPYFLERSTSKFSKRRQSLDLRTDFPIFRPSIVDTVLSARTRLLDMKNCYMSASETVTCADKSAAVFTEKHERGLGKCVLQPSDIDVAVRAYTEFVQRYALHGLLYTMSLSLSGLTVQESCLAVGKPAAVLHHSLSGLLADVHDMESSAHNTPIERYLEQLQVPVSDKPAAVSELLGLTDSNKKCCLLTDSHIPTVLAHQLRVLQSEFPSLFSSTAGVRNVASLTSAFCSPNNSDRDTETFKSSIKEALDRLVSLERSYARGVRECKHKDVVRASGIIPDHPSRSQQQSHITDPTIASAETRANNVEKCVNFVREHL